MGTGISITPASESYSEKSKAPNSGCSVLGIKNPKTAAIQSAINDVLKAEFGKKTWSKLSFLIRLEERGLTDSVAKHRIACTREYDLLDVILLLGSELGDKIEGAALAAAGLRPGWFKKRKRLERLARVKKELQQLTLELEADEKADLGNE